MKESKKKNFTILIYHEFSRLQSFYSYYLILHFYFFSFLFLLELHYPKGRVYTRAAHFFLSLCLYHIQQCRLKQLTNFEIIFPSTKLINSSLQHRINILKTKRNLLYIWNQSYRAVNTFHHGYLKTKRNLLYIRNQSVPRCKHFPPWSFKDQT